MTLASISYGTQEAIALVIGLPLAAFLIVCLVIWAGEKMDKIGERKNDEEK